MYWFILPKIVFTVVVKTCDHSVSLVLGCFSEESNSTFLHIKRAHKFLGNIYLDPSVKWLKSKNYLQYPTYTPKYTTSDPFWMQNGLQFDINSCMHNNLKTIIKILSTIYLSLAVLFPFVPSYWNHESWVHKTQKMSIIQ